jgi:hypothetical protein
MMRERRLICKFRSLILPRVRVAPGIGQQVADPRVVRHGIIEYVV